MIRRTTTLLLAALLLAACAAGDPAAGPPPPDFQLRYDWREGSLPPPYHYEYTITLAADGSGTMTMLPGYPGPGVPTFEERFTLAPEALDRLHDALIAEGLLREGWREQRDPPVGGASWTLEVTHAGRTVVIPAFPVEAQQARAAAIAAAVEAIVPQAARDSLERQRAAYAAGS
jgi:hypothetical protein